MQIVGEHWITCSTPFHLNATTHSSTSKTSRLINCFNGGLSSQGRSSLWSGSAK